MNLIKIDGVKSEVIYDQVCLSIWCHLLHVVVSNHLPVKSFFGSIQGTDFLRIYVFDSLFRIWELFATELTVRNWAPESCHLGERIQPLTVESTNFITSGEVDHHSFSPDFNLLQGVLNN